MTNAQRADRRSRAREAFDDELAGRATWAERLHFAREVAIETAMRVQVTDELVQAARPNTAPGSGAWKRTRARLVRAFEAAGFEVEP